MALLLFCWPDQLWAGSPPSEPEYQAPTMGLQAAPTQGLAPQDLAHHDLYMLPAEASSATSSRQRSSSDFSYFGAIPEPPPPLDEPCYDLNALGRLPFELEQPLPPALLHALQQHCGQMRRLTRSWLQRSWRFRTWLSREFAAMNAPDELLWVAIVESALNPQAVSSAGAAGLWQFMPTTGRARGLRVDRAVDERFDIVAATRAAVPYLLELRERFGSWGLAFAAYNAGEGHVRGEVRFHNANDFWRMNDFEAFYAGSRDYAMRIMALAIIDRFPEAFGFDELEPDEPWGWEEVLMPRGVRLSLIAEAAGVPLDELRDLNAALRTPETPAGEGPYPLRVPSRAAHRLVESYDQLAERYGSEHYVLLLKHGETVADIAMETGIPERVLRAMSGLDGSGPVAPETEILIPTRGGRPAGQAAAPRTPPTVVIAAQPPRPLGRELILYDVVYGDTAARVARAVGVSLDELCAWNDLDPQARLWTGMTLALWVHPDTDLSLVVHQRRDEVTLIERGTEEFAQWRAAEASRRARQRVQRHVVRSGETVGGIARRYGVRAADIIRWNNLDSNASIRIGQSLTVRR